ncbi:ketosteroid isomerase-like protein [Kitasatospora acidiphila]
MTALSEILAKDVTHHVPGSHPLAGDHKGLTAVLGYYQQLGVETAGSFRVEVRQLFADGRGHVMSVHHATAERGGKKLDADGGIMFKIVGEKVTDLDECVEDLDIGNDFWA